MRKRSLAAGAAAAAVVALTAAPAVAATPVRDTPGTPMCATSHLSAALHGGDAGAGNLYQYLVLTNHGSTACHLTGFPGVSLLDGSGRQIGAPATREQETYAPVVLKPGGSASDTVHTVNHQGTCLPTSAKVRVYPPGNTASLVLPGRITNCDDQLTITPLAAGTGGNPAGQGPTGSPVPTRSATPAPTQSAPQVSAVPSGAPDTGLASGSSGGDGGPALAAAVGGALALGGAGFAVARRRSRARG
jgi:hypothetical protein